MKKRCTSCNEIIQNEEIMCSNCRHIQMKIGMILQSLNATKEQLEEIYAAMEKKDDN